MDEPEGGLSELTEQLAVMTAQIAESVASLAEMVAATAARSWQMLGTDLAGRIGKDCAEIVVLMRGPAGA